LGTASASNAAQCGQVNERNSTSLTRAAGLPICMPPSGVMVAACIQSRAAAWGAGWATGRLAGTAKAVAGTIAARPAIHLAMVFNPCS
jgi:hypothetical protein